MNDVKTDESNDFYEQSVALFLTGFSIASHFFSSFALSLFFSDSVRVSIELPFELILKVFW